MMHYPIKHQRQPTDNTCVSACIAMILGCDVDAVIKEFHSEFFAGNISILSYLEECGIEAKVGTVGFVTRMGKTQIVSVPSLNEEAKFHSVVSDTRGGKGYQIYDPQMGNEGKRFYTAYGKNGNGGVALQSFSVDIVVTDARFFKE